MSRCPSGRASTVDTRPRRTSGWSATTCRIWRRWRGGWPTTFVTSSWRTLSQNPRPTFVAVAPEALPEGMPDEPEDLRPLYLVCCADEVKALWDWDGPFYCPRCGAHHGGMSGRQQVHLEFIQE